MQKYHTYCSSLTAIVYNKINNLKLLNNHTLYVSSHMIAYITFSQEL